MLEMAPSPRPAPPASAEPLLPQFYAGRDVLITGATGFMGKVLVERLLRTCPQVGRLFLLVRPKRDAPPAERLARLQQSQVFDGIRERCPQQLRKMVVVAGDVTLPGLGIEPRDLAALHQVSVVFHSAATLKFNEPLRQAVNQNIRSVIRLMDICDQLPNMQAFVHVSTAYSNAERRLVEERVYEAPVPLRHLLALTDALTDDALARLTPDYIWPKPNTYTFTKAMAEVAVSERVNRKYSAAIFRPSIVVSAVRHPRPGWVESLNGPGAFVVATGKGLLRALRCSPSAAADLVPVDIAIDTLIAVAAHTAAQPSCDDVMVYNCCSCENPITWGGFKRRMMAAVRRHPFDDALYFPCGFITGNSVVHFVLELFLQKIPLHTANVITKIFGIKTRMDLALAYGRLRAVEQVLEFFTVREWAFATDNVRRLRQAASPADRQLFQLDPAAIDWDEHVENLVKGSRKYLLKEKDANIPKAKKHMRRLKCAHGALVAGALLLLARLLLPAFLVTAARLRRIIARMLFFNYSKH